MNNCWVEHVSALVVHGHLTQTMQTRLLTSLDQETGTGLSVQTQEATTHDPLPLKSLNSAKWETEMGRLRQSGVGLEAPPYIE